MFKGVGGNNVLRDQPREKAPDAAEVAVDGMTGKTSLLYVVEAVTREASFLLQIKNKSTELTAADLSRVRAYAT